MRRHILFSLQQTQQQSISRVDTADPPPAIRQLPVQQVADFMKVSGNGLAVEVGPDKSVKYDFSVGGGVALIDDVFHCHPMPLNFAY